MLSDFDRFSQNLLRELNMDLQRLYLEKAVVQDYVRKHELEKEIQLIKKHISQTEQLIQNRGYFQKLAFTLAKRMEIIEFDDFKKAMPQIKFLSLFDSETSKINFNSITHLSLNNRKIVRNALFKIYQSFSIYESIQRKRRIEELHG